MRRRVQREAKENDDEETYKILKGRRYLLLSNLSNLKEKDKAALANNRRLYENYTRHGWRLPPGERYMHSDREDKLNKVLKIIVYLISPH